jgi:hypothetical protein
MFVTSWERLGVGLPIADKAMSLAVRRIVMAETMWNLSGSERLGETPRDKTANKITVLTRYT